LCADSSKLLEQVRQVEMKLKEKKIKSFREKIKREQEIKSRQLIKSFVRQNCNYEQHAQALQELSLDQTSEK
jgi:lipoate-protein ligase A